MFRIKRLSMVLVAVALAVSGLAFGVAPAGAATTAANGFWYTSPSCPNYAIHLSSNTCGTPRVTYFQPSGCESSIYCGQSGRMRTEVWVYSTRYRKWYPVPVCSDDGECRQVFFSDTAFCCGTFVGWTDQPLSFSITRPDLKYWSRTVVWGCPYGDASSCGSDDFERMGTVFYLYCPNKGRPYDRTATRDQHCGS